jgi:hypothetical protein
MHDWLEKIASTDGQSVVVAFISDKKITLVEYNCGLLNINLTDYETGDQVLPLKNGADKIPGKALSVALHLRLMPLVLSQTAKDVEGTLLFDFLRVLHRLNEYILADVVCPYDAIVLEVGLKLFFFDYVELVFRIRDDFIPDPAEFHSGSRILYYKN